MDQATQDAVLYLFALALPISVFCWAVVFLAAGLPTDPDESVVFSVIARAGFVPAGGAGRLLLAAIGLAVMNSVPAFSLAKSPFGPLVWVILGYVVAQAICVGVMALYVRHVESRNQDS
jgi:hypothetical protein